jgi:hypothetical protein
MTDSDSESDQLDLLKFEIPGRLGVCNGPDRARVGPGTGSDRTSRNLKTTGTRLDAGQGPKSGIMLTVTESSTRLNVLQTGSARRSRPLRTPGPPQRKLKCVFPWKVSACNPWTLQKQLYRSLFRKQRLLRRIPSI